MMSEKKKKKNKKKKKKKKKKKLMMMMMTTDVICSQSNSIIDGVTQKCVVTRLVVVPTHDYFWRHPLRSAHLQ
jgi:hypothetical protein